VTYSLQRSLREVFTSCPSSTLQRSSAYLKVWLGVLVVTDISVFGWLISNLGAATEILLWAAVIAVVSLTAGILVLHRRIERHIDSLKGL